MHKNLKRVSYSGNGFVIKLANSSYPVGGNSEIDILSGVETNIAVERIYSTQLPFPYSDCTIDGQTSYYNSELYDMFLKTKTRFVLTYKQNVHFFKPK